MDGQDGKPGQTPAFLVGADGKFADGWLNHEVIPQELRTDKTLAAVTDFPAALKMLVNAQKLIGRDKVVVPKEGASQAELDAYFKAVGWPETPDGYKAPAKDPNGPADLPWNEELFKSFAKSMHGHHFTQAQIEAAAKFFNEQAIGQHNAAKAKQEEATRAALLANRKKWGTQYTEQLQLADNAAAAFIDPEDLEYVTNKGFLTDPVVQRIFAAVGSAITPDRMRGGRGPVDSPQTIQAQIDGIMGDPKSPYFDAKHPQHAATVQKMQSLYEQLHKPAA